MQLVVGEFQRVVARHDLDQISPALDLITHGAAHLVGTAGFAADPVGMAAGLDDAFAGHQKARSRKDALRDGLLGKEVGVVDTPRSRTKVYSLHAGILACCPRPCRHEFPGASIHALLAELVDPVPAEVCVAVHHAGHQRFALASPIVFDAARAHRPA